MRRGPGAGGFRAACPNQQPIRRATEREKDSLFFGKRGAVCKDWALVLELPGCGREEAIDAILGIVTKPSANVVLAWDGTELYRKVNHRTPRQPGKAREATPAPAHRTPEEQGALLEFGNHLRNLMQATFHGWHQYHDIAEEALSWWWAHTTADWWRRGAGLPDPSRVDCRRGTG